MCGMLGKEDKCMKESMCDNETIEILVKKQKDN